MIIRKATVKDADEVAKVHRESIRELCKDHYSAEQLDAWTDALLGASYPTLIRAHEVLVAQDDSELLGFCVINLAEGFLNATYVRKTAVRRGIGRQLVMAAEAAGKRSGCTRIRLHATLNAVGFYERLGYLCGDMSTNRLPTGVELPCVLMSKSFAP